MPKFFLIIFCLLILTTGCGRQTPDNTAKTTTTPPAPKQLSQEEVLAGIVKRAGAPLFEGMGKHTHPITTKDKAAQRYFDQGMALASGFNHAEAIRSFRAAQRLDPECAMCFWGEALATGPHINVTSNGKAVMSPEKRQSAYVAIQKAIKLKSNATETERDYIDAQTARYNGQTDTPREPLDIAYANAMRKLVLKYPEDNDALAMFAEAVMNTMPWNYWLDAENPKPETVEVITALETVMTRDPEHPLALHLYIHAVEASSNPGRAEAAADTLGDLVPGSGHLIHMPSHIYWRIGRYFDASEANVLAASVDEKYIAQCNAQGFYPALYYPHNIHFLWASSSMEGRSEIAIEAGKKVAANIRMEQIKQFPAVEFFHTIPLLSLVRFGKWDEIMQETKPDNSLPYSTAIWHYARGIAFVRQKDIDAARQEQQALAMLKNTEVMYRLDGADYPASRILEIADQLLTGDIAGATNHHDEAVKHFQTAVAIQDDLPYMEPPFWYYPSRQTLGNALIQAKNFKAAEQVYRDDLMQYPRNGWSLYGLWQSLSGQKKNEEAIAVKEKFDAIWARADVVLSASVM